MHYILTFFVSVKTYSSTSLVMTSSVKVFSLVDRNLMALSRTMSSPCKIWEKRPPRVPGQQKSSRGVNQHMFIIQSSLPQGRKTQKTNRITWYLRPSPKYYERLFLKCNNLLQMRMMLSEEAHKRFMYKTLWAVTKRKESKEKQA